MENTKNRPSNLIKTLDLNKLEVESGLDLKSYKERFLMLANWYVRESKRSKSGEAKRLSDRYRDRRNKIEKAASRLANLISDADGIQALDQILSVRPNAWVKGSRKPLQRWEDEDSLRAILGDITKQKPRWNRRKKGRPTLQTRHQLILGVAQIYEDAGGVGRGVAWDRMKEDWDGPLFRLTYTLLGQIGDKYSFDGLAQTVRQLRFGKAKSEIRHRP